MAHFKAVAMTEAVVMILGCTVEVCLATTLVGLEIESVVATLGGLGIEVVVATGTTTLAMITADADRAEVLCRLTTCCVSRDRVWLFQTSRGHDLRVDLASIAFWVESLPELLPRIVMTTTE